MTSTTQQLPPNLEKIIQKFQRITEPKRRYEYLLWFCESACRLFPMRPKFPPIEYRGGPPVYPRCNLTATLQDGCIVLPGPMPMLKIPKGLVGLLMEGLNGIPPEEVVQLSPDFIQRTGLNVSPHPVLGAMVFYNIFKDHAATGDRSDRFLSSDRSIYI